MSPSDASDRLYHYTDARGLIGVVSRAVLWATDAEFLNDAQELQFGRKELYDALMTRAAELSPEEPQDESDLADYSRATVMRSAAAHLKPGGMFLQQQEHFVYVSCFCEDGDLLSQWRGYAAGGGFAIGFSTSVLRRVHVEVPTNMPDADTNDHRAAQLPALELSTRLEPIQYGEDAVDGMTARVVDEIAPQPVGSPGARGWALAQTVVLPALATVKHRAFDEEREWRLIVVGAPKRFFRAGRLGVIPYIELEIEPGAIKEVVVGPGADADVRRRGVERLLNENGAADATIRHSRAPHRA